MFKKIQLNGNAGKDKFILVDEEDFIKISEYNNHYHHTGYAVTTRRINGKNKQIRIHRLILNANENDYVDHINHDKLDNRRCNLRICTNSQNQANRLKKRNASSIYKGVRKIPESYQAFIKFKGKAFHLGTFNNEIKAAEAYNNKAKELFGEFALLNIIKYD